MTEPRTTDMPQPWELLEQAIEALIGFLDLIDRDPDLEDNGDLEEQCEDEGAQCEDEGAEQNTDN